MHSLAKPLTAMLLIYLLFSLGCTPAEESNTYLGRVGEGISTDGLVNSSLVREVTAELASGNIVADQFMLKFAEGVTQNQVNGLFDKYGLEIIKELPQIGYFNVAIREDDDLANIAAILASDPLLSVVEPVYIERAFDTAITPNDAKFPDQWGLFHINAPLAWVIEPGYVTPPGPTDVVVNDVLVAVIDTGVDYKHEDLNPSQAMDNVKFFEGINYTQNGNPFFDPMDDNGHGTMVAGILGALSDNLFGIASVAWHPRILPIKILDNQGNGTSANSADGILYAADQFINALDPEVPNPWGNDDSYFDNPYNARLIINMSYGYSRLNTEGQLQSEKAAIDYAVSKGAVLVAAAGDDGKPINDGSSTVYPAGHPDVIAVGAIDQANGLLLESNTPSIIDPIDSTPYLVAPGKDIVSTSLHGFGEPYAVGTGTSFAAPFVSGTVALMWSQFPFLSAHQIKDILKNTANANAVGDIGIDPMTGWGLVDAYAALQENFQPYEDDMIVRAFTNPVLHGDIIFIVRTKFQIMEPGVVALDSEGNLINGGWPLSLNLGWDDDNDGLVDEPAQYHFQYFPNEFVFFQLDDATYLGRFHLHQDIGMRTGSLVIDMTAVPKFFLEDPTLPMEITAQTSIEITDFNYS